MCQSPWDLDARVTLNRQASSAQAGLGGVLAASMDDLGARPRAQSC